MNMKYRNPHLTKLLATTIICGAACVATPAFAQDDPDAPDTVQTDDDAPIVVTGSRIRQPNLTAVSPVTAVSSQEVRLTGTTRAEDLINSLPQAFAGQGSTIANGSSGTATLNLRGLGSVRTLVLINGRRLVPGDPGSSAADINVIPAAMIDRVDVLTGGASSVYGSDAVAGVVNFIMDTDFTGVRFDTQYSFFQHDNGTDPSVRAALDARGFGYPTGSVADGGTWDANLAIGAAFDDGRGHVMIYAGYRNSDPVLQGRRDYSACALSANAAVTWTCGGSATSANGTVFTWTDTLQIGANRTLIPGFTPYNFGPVNHYQRPDERYTLGGFASYEISPALRPYLEVMFMDDRTVSQIAASGHFGNTLTINCDNPLLSAQQLAILCDPGNLLINGNVNEPDVDPSGATAPFAFTDPFTGATYNRGFSQLLRRNVEGGGRQDDLQHTSFRIVAGMRGDLSQVWSYDVYYQHGRTNFAQTYLNDFSVTRLFRALDVVDDPRTPGVVDPVCRSVLDGSDPNCVPWDIWATDQVDPDSLSYLQVPLMSRGIVQQTVANASLTGNLGEWGIQFPWAENGVGIALGVEYRKDSLEFVTDVSFQTGDGAGQGAPTLPVSGDYDVREAFAEIRIPIVENSGIHLLAIEGGFRYSDYDLGNRSISTETYKIGLDFAPVRDIRFRAAYNRAVRAPNIQELFAPRRVALNGAGDPCEGAVPTASLAACQAMGVSAGQYGTIAPNPAAQYNGLIGGNPNLDPEVADTITLGIVLQPRFLPGFALTVDWFDIEIDSAIQQIGQDTILATCAATLDPGFCGLVNRDSFGSIWRTSNGFVVDTNQNIGSFSTRGVDIQATYSTGIGSLGNLSFNLVGTWLDELITDNGVAAPYDCVGLYGNICGVPTPEWRHTARINWAHPSGIGASMRWRYFGPVRQDTTELGGTVHPSHERLGAQNYFDLTLTARIGDNYAFRLGVNNILDREPPIVGSQACPAGPCNGNAWSQVYDALGRYIFAGVTLDF